MNEPITKITDYHNYGDAEKRDSSVANGLMAKFYFTVGCEVILTSNFWVEVRFHNGYKGNVVYVVYKYSKGPRSKNGNILPESVVVEFYLLDDDV